MKVETAPATLFLTSQSASKAFVARGLTLTPVVDEP